MSCLWQPSCLSQDQKLARQCLLPHTYQVRFVILSYLLDLYWSHLAHLSPHTITNMMMMMLLFMFMFVSILIFISHTKLPASSTGLALLWFEHSLGHDR